MTYKDLLIKISEFEDFDPYYSLAHLTVDECFNSIEADSKDWDDIADDESLRELNKYL